MISWQVYDGRRVWPLALLVAWPHWLGADYIHYGEGSLSLDGAGYTYICLAETIDLHNYGGYVSGRLDLSALNSAGVTTFFEIGLLAEGQYSFWHTSQGDPEDVWAHGTDHFEGEWFNHAVYLLGMEWNNPGGGTSQVFVEGVGWGPSLEYGVQKDQWGDDFDPSSGSHNWMAWDEEFSLAHLYIGLWSGETGQHTVSLQDVSVVTPEPGTFSLVVMGLRGIRWMSRRRKHGNHGGGLSWFAVLDKTVAKAD